MLVAEVVSDGIHFGSGTEQVSVVAVGLEVSEGQQEEDSGDPHPLSDILVGLAPALSSLHEADEVADVVG